MNLDEAWNKIKAVLDLVDHRDSIKEAITIVTRYVDGVWDEKTTMISDLVETEGFIDAVLPIIPKDGYFKICEGENTITVGSTVWYWLANKFKVDV